MDECWFKSAFFNMITHYHTGRLASDKKGNNAYTLNNVPQFSLNEIDLNIKVINLKRRPDRLEKIKKKLNELKLNFTRYEAMDLSNTAVSNEQYKIFNGNDFYYRDGVVGCALSHYNLWKELVKSDKNFYIIIEDDCEFCINVKDCFTKYIKEIESKDLIFFGYHNVDKNINNNTKDVESKIIEIKSFNKLDTNSYYGGTHCYSITKNGAKKLLNYIDNNGIKHGIDYLMAKVQNESDVYTCDPLITYANFIGHSSPTEIADTDIQYNYNVSSKPDDSFIFIQGLDQIGYDIHTLNSSIYDLKKLAKDIPCVGFNTLGFFKEKITELTISPYYSPINI